jgi:hypothetical protein
MQIIKRIFKLAQIAIKRFGYVKREPPSKVATIESQKEDVEQEYSSDVRTTYVPAGKAVRTKNGFVIYNGRNN